MIGQGLGRLALAEKLSIGQLQDAIKNKTIPAYIGIPLLEEKMMFEQRMRSAGQGIAPQMDQPPIAQQVMAQASQMDGMGEMSEEGIDQLPVPTPELAGGGIVAFEDGGQVQRFQNQGLVQNNLLLEEAIQMMLQRDPSFNESYLRKAVAEAPPEMRSRLLTQLRDRETRKFARQGDGVPGAQNIDGAPTVNNDAVFGMGAGQTSMSRKELVDLMSLQELQEYNRSGKVPERLRDAVAGRPIESGSFLGGLPLTRQPAEFATPAAPIAPTPPAAPAAATTPATTTKTLPNAPKSEVSLITEEAQKLIPGQGLTPESFKAQQAAFGISADPDADFKKRIEELSKGTKEERQQAKYMALIQAGLGIMGGTSRNALENIAAGAQKGLAQYGADIKDIKKEERDLMKMQAELARAADARKRGDFKAFQDASDRADDLKLKQEKLAIDRQTAAIQKAYYEGRLTDAQYRNSLAKARLGQAQVQATLKAREFFMDREEPALRSEFEKRFGKDWAKSPELMMQFNRQKEGRIRDLAMLGGQDSGIPSAEDLMED